MSDNQKKLLFNAFFMCSPSQSWAGLWSHPRSTGLKYNQIEFWTDLAQQVERGLLDGIFLADATGVPDIYGGSPDAVIRSGAFFPSSDPMMVIPAMAAVTDHICFGVTGNTTYEPPYLLARRLSTLDHLTSGRFAWNVVTGVLPATAKAMGAVKMMEHDARYDVADEYMDLCYKLWEGCWEEGSAVHDQQRQIFADPNLIHTVYHHGENFRCAGIHLVEPSPQRTPLIFAAGASKRGREFAGRHAECTFMSTNNMEFARRTSQAFRQAAVDAGRTRDSLRVFNAATIIVAPTEEEALARVKEYQRYSSDEGNLAIFGAWTGIDFSRYAPDDPVELIQGDAIQSIVESMRETLGDHPLTVRDLARFGPVGGREAFIVGTPQHICDELIRWRDVADIDGFNLVRTVEPEGLNSFIELVIPELQNRGAFKTEYATGTMREKLFPSGSATLPPEHYALRFKAGRAASTA